MRQDEAVPNVYGRPQKFNIIERMKRQIFKNCQQEQNLLFLPDLIEMIT